MYRTIEAIYRQGAIVPLEEVDMPEKSRLLIVVLEEPKKGKTKWKELRGKYKGALSSVDEFIARKQEEKRLEL